MTPPLPELPEFSNHQHSKNITKTWMQVLNNFHLRFPRKAFKDTEGKRYAACIGYYRTKYKTPSEWNTIHSDRHENRGPDWNTDMYMNMSPRQYFDALDAACEKCGIKKTKLKEATFIRRTKPREDPSWIEVLAPIYIYLRKRGFNHIDLTR